MARNLTQGELAKTLGVSQMTISRAIRNSSGVSPKLKQRIQEMVEKSDYVPNHVAVGLRTQATTVIGLIMPDVTDSFFPGIARAVEVHARENGYSIILGHNHESYDEEARVINLLRGYRVRGFIIAPAGNESQADVYQRLQELGVPFVFIDRTKKAIDSSFVATDLEEGAFKLGQYLLAKGYRRWGYLRGPKGVSSSEAHANGIKRSCRNCKPGVNMVVENAGFSENDGYDAVQRLLGKARPDVIIAVNDSVAIGAFRFLKAQGIIVPRDVALAGFSDLNNTDILEVPLTTVREHTREIGRRAIEILMAEINDPDLEKQKVFIEPELIVRDSA